MSVKICNLDEILLGNNIRSNERFEVLIAVTSYSLVDIYGSDTS
jgi:hypothetical protein